VKNANKRTNKRPRPNVTHWREWASIAADYRVCLSCGAQRSGTQLAARIMCHETGWRYMEHDAFPPHEMGIRNLLLKRKRIVIHAPSMLPLVPFLGESGILCMMTLRDIAAIKRSEQRINWLGEDRERRLLGLGPNEWAALRKTELVGAFARLDWAIVTRYEDMADHDLWVPPDQRKRWDSRDWTHKEIS
jgi:hypothetical protein